MKKKVKEETKEQVEDAASAIEIVNITFELNKVISKLLKASDVIDDLHVSNKILVKAIRAYKTQKKSVNSSKVDVDSLITDIEVLLRETELSFTASELANIFEVDEYVIGEIAIKRPDLVAKK